MAQHIWHHEYACKSPDLLNLMVSEVTVTKSNEYQQLSTMLNALIDREYYQACCRQPSCWHCRTRPLCRPSLPVCWRSLLRHCRRHRQDLPPSLSAVSASTSLSPTRRRQSCQSLSATTWHPALATLQPHRDQERWKKRQSYYCYNLLEMLRL